MKIFWLATIVVAVTCSSYCGASVINSISTFDRISNNYYLYNSINPLCQIARNVVNRVSDTVKVFLRGRNAVQNSNQNAMVHGYYQTHYNGYMKPYGYPNGVHRGIPNVAENLEHGQQHVI